jgi:hypothetical protein
MGFLNGRVTFVRYRVAGESPLPFGPEHLEALERQSITSRSQLDTPDGVTVGWAGGDHVLDTRFDLEKNILDDALHAGVRVDTNKIPSELLRAYTQIELDARTAENPDARPSKAQREEAKEAARARAEAEAADGRFRRRKVHPVLWDAQHDLLYVGTSSAQVLDRVAALFRETFDRDLEPVTAGRLAADHAGRTGRLRLFEELAPSQFAPAAGLDALAWSPDPASPDYLGNEFLVWLWHHLDDSGAPIALADGSELSAMVTKTLTLDCPRGETGRDSLSDTGPTRLPEAREALRSGKLPRKAGLLLNRHGQDYELTLQAESLAVSGLALPRAEGAVGRELKLARIEALRHLADTLDALLDAFLDHRTQTDWPTRLDQIRAWLTAA